MQHKKVSLVARISMTLFLLIEEEKVKAGFFLYNSCGLVVRLPPWLHIIVPYGRYGDCCELTALGGRLEKKKEGAESGEQRQSNKYIAPLTFSFRLVTVVFECLLWLRVCVIRF